MSVKEISDERREKRYAKIKEKVAAEYGEEAELLRKRSDYLPEYEYFLGLLGTPCTSAALRERVGKPLAGLFCIHVPLELVDAFDLHPVKLCSGSQSVQRVAAAYLPVLMCPMLKAFIGSFDLQEESFAAYKTVLLPTTCDWVVKLPEIMGRSEENIHYLELPHIKNGERAQGRWLEEITALQRHLEKITGKKPDRKKLAASIDKFTELWAALTQLNEMKRTGKIAGVWYTVITNSFFLDSFTRWRSNLLNVLDKLADADCPLRQGKVFVAGSPIVFPNLKLLHLIEQAGMTVAADDICSSERILPGGVALNEHSEYGMLRALGERYHKACVCPTFADNDRRVNNIIRVTETYGIKGVIFNLLKGCHPYDIEAVTIEKKLKQRGLKFLKIETDYGKEDSQNILTRLEAFSKTL